MHFMHVCIMFPLKSFSEIKFVVMLTKVDFYCDAVAQDLSTVFRAETVAKSAIDTAQLFGISEKSILVQQVRSQVLIVCLIFQLYMSCFLLW